LFKVKGVKGVTTTTNLLTFDASILKLKAKKEAKHGRQYYK
jgi:hypothetical protein